MPVMHPKVDMVTIGAGFTAAILASKLTRAGMSVVSLEQGGNQSTYPDFAHNHDWLRFVNRFEMMVRLDRESWTWRANERLPALPMRQYGAFHPGESVGGSIVHWTAMYWRFLPHDFRYLSRHLERYGRGRLPPGSDVRDWPVTYEELEPHYDELEYDIGVSGAAGNLGGVVQEGGNPFEGPRSRPFPLPPLAPTTSGAMFGRAASELGYQPFPMPAGILSQAYRDASGRWRSGCLYCGYCTRFGCEVDAKYSPITTHLPIAMETGAYEIRPHCRVLSIEVDSDGLATGVTYVDAAGREHFQPAEIVLVSGYTMSNVKLLLVSRSPAHPEGVGNDRGRVGRNLTYQIWRTPAVGLFENRRFNRYMANGATQQVIYEFYGDNFDHSALDFIGGGQIFAGGGEQDPLAVVQAIPEIEGEDSQGWGRAWKERFVRHWDSFFPITYQGESIPYEQHRMDLDPNYRDFWGQPLVRLTYDWHENERNQYRFIAARCREIMEQMGPTGGQYEDELPPFNIYDYNSTHVTGGCIMGDSPADSVTNRYGQVWDTPNVFVTGAALFPQNPGSNPSGTVGALAYLTAKGILDQYRRDPGRLMG